MECNIARKKLKYYAQDEIINEIEKNELEEHIKSCPICKRELYLWQDVIEKQKYILSLQGKIPVDIRERMKYRIYKDEKEKFLPPTVRRIYAIGKLFSSTKGKLIIESIIILISLIILIKYLHGGKNIIVPFLIIFGFLVLFFIMLKDKK